MTTLTRRDALHLGLFLALALPGGLAQAAGDDWAVTLVKTARSQIGVTTLYDPAYVKLAYPGGDVASDRGVCTDVVIRAYRQAFNLDLQKRLHEDMQADFSAYPRRWGLNRPDPNIDHRRVLNLAVYFKRKQASLPTSENPDDYRPGDLVTQTLPGNLPHIAIVSDNRSQQAPERPLVIHNIGQGTREEDTLFSFPHTGHYRFAPEA